MGVVEIKKVKENVMEEFSHHIENHGLMGTRF